MHVTELQRGIYALMTEIGDSRGDSNFGLIVGDTEAIGQQCFKAETNCFILDK